MKAEHNNLIIVPVGLDIDHFVKLHELEFNMDDHWRNTANERNYDILAVQYGDYVPQEGTYDFLVKAKGNKWKIIKQLDKEIDFSQWDYIGAYDDDVLTTTDCVNAAFNYAKLNNVAAYQQALSPGSESNWPVTRQEEGWAVSFTNFMEIMCPVFRQDCFFMLMGLIDKYDVNHGWGLDFIFSDLFNSDIGIIHFAPMYHPSRPSTGSSYSKDEAFNEMNNLVNSLYPSIKKGWVAKGGEVKSFLTLDEV